MRRLQILFVDNDANVHSRMQQALERDFAVQCVRSIHEAVSYLNAPVLPDILITEVMIGQENGLDLCRYVRGISTLRHLPIMLLTSRTALQDKVAGFSAGADDYVVKPFDPHHLTARIRLLSRIKRIERKASNNPGINA
ncbi:response regulator transcription factor [Tengunoibacter tsumagoiensis]|uniref:Response regulatory domain-containing protein n=1 Tax=Tengunoibacter tsumagoiensis TaxID=2014871 RepID=A0A402A1R1_9CHLR|nr:response regulator transcription factor [Tengunoibacter tsumagoiensis]GCE13083.1 hypothetical protein KTT_29420 [Tengunoibacter tsumagoiensis]